MKALSLQTEITPDGKLLLDLPCELPPGPAEVVVVVQPKSAPVGPPFDTLEGLFVGQLPPAADIEAELRDIRQQWQHRLDASP